MTHSNLLIVYAQHQFTHINAAISSTLCSESIRCAGFSNRTILRQCSAGSKHCHIVVVVTATAAVVVVVIIVIVVIVNMRCIHRFMALITLSTLMGASIFLHFHIGSEVS